MYLPRAGTAEPLTLLARYLALGHFASDAGGLTRPVPGSQEPLAIVGWLVPDDELAEPFPSGGPLESPALHAELESRGILQGAEVIPWRRTLGKIFAERATAASTGTARTARAA